MCGQTKTHPVPAMHAHQDLVQSDLHHCSSILPSRSGLGIRQTVPSRSGKWHHPGHKPLSNGHYKLTTKLWPLVVMDILFVLPSYTPFHPSHTHLPYTPYTLAAAPSYPYMVPSPHLTFSSRALWCSNRDLRALSTSTSELTPLCEAACRFTTVILSDRSCRDTRHSRCSRSSCKREAGISGVNGEWRGMREAGWGVGVSVFG